MRHSSENEARNVVLYRIPENEDENRESLKTLILNYTVKIKVPLDNADIIKVARMRKAGSRFDPNRPAPLLVAFSSYAAKSKFTDNFNKVKYLANLKSASLEQVQDKVTRGKKSLLKQIAKYLNEVKFVDPSTESDIIIDGHTYSYQNPTSVFASSPEKPPVPKCLSGGS